VFKGRLLFNCIILDVFVSIQLIKYSRVYTKLIVPTIVGELDSTQNCFDSSPTLSYISTICTLHYLPEWSSYMLTLAVLITMTRGVMYVQVDTDSRVLES